MILHLLRWLRARLRAWLGAPELAAPAGTPWRAKQIDHLLAQAAERLDFVREDEGALTRLLGRRGELEVQIEVLRVPWSNGQVRFEQRVVVTAPRPLSPAPVAFVPRGRAPVRALTHDPSFDRDMEVEGPGDAALALLSSAARAVIGGNGGRWRIDGAVLDWRAQRAPVFLSATSEQIIDLAAAFLLAGSDLVEALGLRVRHDPSPGVRRRALALLLETHPEDPRTIETTRAALQDRLPRLRLDAAISLGAEGRTTLIALLGADSTPSHLRRAAARQLEPGDADARAALRALIAPPNRPATLDGVELLGRLGSPEDVAWLDPMTRSFGRGAQLRRAATEARDRILARHSDYAAGQLALAVEPDLTGAVSPSSDVRSGDAPAAGNPEPGLRSHPEVAGRSERAPADGPAR